MSQRYNDNIKKTQKAKVDRKSTKDLKDLSTLSENSVESQVQERALLGLRIYLLEYTRKVAASSPQKLQQLYLVFQGRAQLEHSSHIVKIGVEGTC